MENPVIKPDTDSGRLMPVPAALPRRPNIGALVMLLCLLSFSGGASAIPAFARQYGISCAT